MTAASRASKSSSASVGCACCTACTVAQSSGVTHLHSRLVQQGRQRSASKGRAAARTAMCVTLACNQPALSVLPCSHAHLFLLPRRCRHLLQGFARHLQQDLIHLQQTAGWLFRSKWCCAAGAGCAAVGSSSSGFLIEPGAPQARQHRPPSCGCQAVRHLGQQRHASRRMVQAGRCGQGVQGAPPAPPSPPPGPRCP